MSDKRTLSFSIAVRSRGGGGDYDTDSNYQLQPNPLPYRERFLKLISHEILTNDNDRRNFHSGFKWCLPPLFMFTLTCFEVSDSKISLPSDLYKRERVYFRSHPLIKCLVEESYTDSMRVLKYKD